MVKRKKKILTGTQKDLIRAMIRARRPQSTYRIGKRSNKAWNTAKVNLEILKRKKVVEKKRKRGVSIWSLN